jgi:hypothetical protein
LFVQPFAQNYTLFILCIEGTGNNSDTGYLNRPYLAMQDQRATLTNYNDNGDNGNSDAAQLHKCLGCKTLAAAIFANCVIQCHYLNIHVFTLR